MTYQWNRLKVAALGAVLATSVTFGVVATTYAQDQTQAPSTSQGIAQPGRHGGRGGFGLRGAALPTLATTLNLSETDLQTALQAGKSIADIATEQGVTLDSVVEAIVTEQTTKLAQAVTDGKLTQAEADARIAELREKLPEMLSMTRPVDGLGLGKGPGFGGGMRGAGLATLAATLNLSEEDLQTALETKSVAALATEQGIALQTVIDAIVAERSTALAQAVTAGKLTQAQADAQLARLAEMLPEQLNQIHTPGLGGHHAGHGRGGPQGEDQQAPSDPTQNPAQEPTPQPNNVPVTPEDAQNA
jgi:hypothetical protein